MATSAQSLKTALEGLDQTALVDSLESQIDAILSDPQKALEQSHGAPGKEYWIFRFDGYLTKASKKALIDRYVDPESPDEPRWVKMTVKNSKEMDEAPGTVSITLYPYDPDGTNG